MTNDLQQLTLRIARDVLGLDAKIWDEYKCFQGVGIIDTTKIKPHQAQQFNLNNPAVIVKMIEWILSKTKQDVYINTNLINALHDEEMHTALAWLCIAILERER